jgi:lysophospholipase L1-like esterase
MVLVVQFLLRQIVFAATYEYDTTRIFRAMAKARRGEDITIGVIGGSITAGNMASTPAKCWANLMTDWWKTTFPESNITLVNAGKGGTGSDVGTFRVQKDLLAHNPDFVVVEFSVNDAEGDGGTYAEKMMEGLVRQILTADSLPGVMLLLMKMKDGSTAQAPHKLVGDYYDIPIVSYADLIDAAVAEDGLTLDDVFFDNWHPNDKGMTYVTGFLIDELNKIYNVLPDDSEIDDVNTLLPVPLVTDTYEHTFTYIATNLIPSTNLGWTIGYNDWYTFTPDDEISFLVEGNAVAIEYSRHNSTNRGQIEIWVDDSTPKILDAYWDQTWGPATVFNLVEDNLPDGIHTLHLKVLGSNSGESVGHFFQLMQVLKAGNIGTTAPIANSGKNVKTVTGRNVDLDGSLSSDPDNDTIISYKWSIISIPVGSLSEIEYDTSITTNITPDLAGYYTIGLIVNDGNYNSIENRKIIHVVGSNSVPLADAGLNDTIALSHLFYFNGSNSTDPDGDSLLFSWKIISQPVGSDIILYNANSKTPKYLAYTEGKYVFGLTVNDSIDDSSEDTVIIEAIEGYTGLEKIHYNNVWLTSYPNPVENIMHIQYYFPVSETASICLYNIAGIKIVDLVNGPQIEGLHEFDYNINELLGNKGFFFLKLTTNKEILFQKIIIR